MTASEKKLVLITGGHGFIGSHIAQRLHLSGNYRIRIADISPSTLMEDPVCDEFIEGNLCDPVECCRAVQGVHFVFHFAATMGGMGMIHEENDFIIYKENHAMTNNILEASINAGVKLILYASSACVYPESLQSSTTSEISLREADVWAYPPPKPQGLYGFEKLVSELLIQQMASKIDIRIARFHNVYGPRGAWCDGREKAPAAMLRKAFVGKRLSELPAKFEMWGDGSQRRSFLYIDDAVDAIVKLVHSSCTDPVNIGCPTPVTVKELADIALKCAGIEPDAVAFQYDSEKPVGVAGRNSNNDLVRSQLDWEPKTSLTDGMRITGEWIESELEKAIGNCERQGVILRKLQSSQVIKLAAQRVTFGVLLPITSRGSRSPQESLDNLQRFAESVVRTTWRDTHSLGETRYTIRIYLVVDEDDQFLLPSKGVNKGKRVFQDVGITDVVVIECTHPRGHICELWRDSAKEAWIDGCDYMSLMGDDVVLLDEGWLRNMHTEFARVASTNNAPSGFGCLAFTDTSFPGMPTFPIIHRTHMDIFEGKVVPDVFVNQDGDPFLFQLYRRWNSSIMIGCRITNGIGGSGNARYAKQHAKDWTFKTLDDAVLTVSNWLQDRGSSLPKMLTLDIVIPSYRVDLPTLKNILGLKPSNTCSVMFIIIIDNPCSPHTAELETKYAGRPDVRIRRHKSNLGASEARNRGMQESSAEWVHFLDDDVVPDPGLLVNAEKIIRAHPKAAGFIGNAVFPCAETIFTAAVQLAGVTYFWDIASKIAHDVPWGVTANLIARRNIKDDVKFDPGFPKTGGGEDIDFCRKKRDFSMDSGGEGFIGAPEVVVTHPWWNNGARSYWRFYMWSFGDGALVKRFPDLSYRDIAPNSAELLLLSLFSAGVASIYGKWDSVLDSFKIFIIIIIANVFHECYRHLWRNPERVRELNLNSKVRGVRWILALIESSFLRMFSEMGRLHGMFSRGEITMLGKRFDWFTGRIGDGPRREEMLNNAQRLCLVLILFAIATWS